MDKNVIVLKWKCAHWATNNGKKRLKEDQSGSINHKPIRKGQEGHRVVTRLTVRRTMTRSSQKNMAITAVPTRMMTSRLVFSWAPRRHRRVITNWEPTAFGRRRQAWRGSQDLRLTRFQDSEGPTTTDSISLTESTTLLKGNSSIPVREASSNKIPKQRIIGVSVFRDAYRMCLVRDLFWGKKKSSFYLWVIASDFVLICLPLCGMT